LINAAVQHEFVEETPDTPEILEEPEQAPAPHDFFYCMDEVLEEQASAAQAPSTIDSAG
jgi:hypothetical protein